MQYIQSFFLFLLSASFLMSEAGIENFSTGKIYYTPFRTGFTYTADSGKKPAELVHRLSSGPGWVVRVRYGPENYALLPGRRDSSFFQGVPVFFFSYDDISHGRALRQKFYTSAQSSSDIPLVYYGKDGFFVEVASILFYRRGDRWIRLKSVRSVSSQPKSEGQLYVEGTPKDAALWVDGRKEAEGLPCRIGGIVPGRHRVEVRREDYSSYVWEGTISGSRAVKLQADLERDTNTVFITTQPSGAEVFVNDSSVGYAPCTLSASRPRKASVHITLPYHRPYNGIHVLSGGAFSFVLQPSSAYIKLGHLSQGYWMLGDSLVAPGRHRVERGRVRVQSIRTSRIREVDTLFFAGTGKTYRFAENNDPPVGYVLVNAESEPFSLRIDGRRVLPGASRYSLSAGEHIVQARTGDGRTWQQRVDIPAGGIRTVKPQFSPGSAGVRGTIAVAQKPTRDDTTLSREKHSAVTARIRSALAQRSGRVAVVVHGQDKAPGLGRISTGFQTLIAQLGLTPVPGNPRDLFSTDFASVKAEYLLRIRRIVGRKESIKVELIDCRRNIRVVNTEICTETDLFALR
ncbi:MAG: PEGA domain-containing protein [Fibrobacterota bacterium]